MKKIDQLISGTFLESLLAELAGIKESKFIQPTDEIKPGEVVIDEMNRFEKAVLTWFMLNMKKLPKSMKEIIGKIDNITNLSALSSHLSFEENKMGLMHKMLWLSIRQRGKNLEYPSLGVRKGFKIVSSPAEDEKDKPGIAGIIIGSSGGIEESLNTFLNKLLKDKDECPMSGSKKRFEF